MKIILDVPDGLQQELEKDAAQQGISLNEYVLQLLIAEQERLQAVSRPRTGAELVALWEREGLIGSRPDLPDSVQYAREIRERNQNRQHG